MASTFSGVLVVVKEENKAVYNALKMAFGHHWVGHGSDSNTIYGTNIHLQFGRAKALRGYDNTSTLDRRFPESTANSWLFLGASTFLNFL